MKVQGRCRCGKITYEAEVDPEKVILCNCTDSTAVLQPDCQLSVPGRVFKLLSGKPAAYIEIAESGAERHHSFCSNCGALMYSCTAAEPGSYWLQAAFLRQRSQLVPKKIIRCGRPCGVKLTLGSIRFDSPLAGQRSPLSEQEQGAGSASL